MKLSFKYSKDYIKMYLFNNLLPQIGMFIAFCILIIFTDFADFFPFLTNVALILFIIRTIQHIVIMIILFRKSYIIINDENLMLRHKVFATITNYSFNDFRECYLILNPKKYLFFRTKFSNSPSIVLHMKDGTKNAVRLVCLTEEDQQKVIEVFKEKGLLKD